MNNNVECHGWKSRHPFVMILLLAGLMGCSGSLHPAQTPVQSKASYLSTPDSAGEETQNVVLNKSNSKEDGSLWRDDAPMMVLFSDQKARTVGDIVTIKIAESSDATNQASTATDRNSSLSASVDAFFNAEQSYPVDHPFFNPFSKVAGGVASEFEGTGTTKRSGDLNAYITALVTRVLPNGNLLVTGSREVLINNENQVIELTGVVRPRDITANNQVLSTYVANARISYNGTGVINQRQKPGWLTNIVMSVWPF